MLNYYHQSQKPQKQKQINLAQIIYIGELPKEIDQYELDQYIRSLGNFDIESLTVKPTKENKAFAYVKFKNKSQAEEALKKIHLNTIKNHVIRAEPFKPKATSEQQQKDNSSNLFVKNLPIDTTPKDLYDLFIKYGNIISIKLKQKENNECLGYGYVNFEKYEEAQKAIEELNNSDYKGKTILVSTFYAKNKRNEEDKFHLVTIKNLPSNLLNNTSLKEFLEKYGQINFCSVITANITKQENIAINPENQQPSENTEQEKLGLVIFENKADAYLAIKELNGKIIDSSLKPLFITLAPITKDILEKLSRAKQEVFKAKYEGCNLVVKNLPKEINDKNLFDIFRQYGDIKTARISTEGTMKEIKDSNGNVIDKEFVYESKGFGYVLYKNAKDAAKAIECLSNKQTEFNNIKLKPIIEYYDYSKSKNSLIQELNNPSTKPKKNINNSNSYSAPNYNSKYQGHNKKNFNNYPYNKFQNQNMAYSNQKYDNAGNNQQYRGNKGGYVQSGYNQGNYNQMQGQNFQQQNPNVNRVQNQNYQNMRQNQQNISHPQMQNIQNSNQIQMQQNANLNNLNQNQRNNMGNTSGTENIEFIQNIQNILKQPHSEERTENLGEVIFYYLLDFIPKYKLNATQGMFDDTILCSKLTGILIHEDDQEILDIVSNTDNLLFFIQNVVVKLLQSKTNDGSN